MEKDVDLIFTASSLSLYLHIFPVFVFQVSSGGCSAQCSFGGESLSSNQCGKGRVGRQQGRRVMQSFRFCVDGRLTLILKDEVISNSEATKLKRPLWLGMVQGKHAAVVWCRDFRRDTPMFQAVTGSESHISVLPSTDRHDGTMQLQCLRVATVVESQHAWCSMRLPW